MLGIDSQTLECKNLRPLLTRISHRSAKRERANARRFKARERQSAQAYWTVRRALCPSGTQ